MDGVILVAVIVPVIALFSMFVHLATFKGGTKGIGLHAKTKSGETHTAHKSRSNT